MKQLKTIGQIEYVVAQTIANMLDAGQSAEDSPEKNFCPQEILTAIEENVNMEHPSLSLDGLLGF